MDNTEITADALAAYKAAYRNLHGKPPTLRDAVEYFGGKLLNVIMANWELKDREEACRKK